MKYIKNIVNNQNFLMDGPEKRYPVTPFMDVYKEKIQSNGSIDKLKLRTVVRGDFKNKEMIGETCSPTESMRTLNYFLEDSSNNKSIVHQLYFIGEFIQDNIKHKLF